MRDYIKPPFLGAAYYPEDWPDEEIDKDIAKMVEAGMNVARIAEFAWYKMEPADGKYEFSWLENVIAKLDEAKIGTILGTPTAVPPRWLTIKHPDICQTMDNTRLAAHGCRRHGCSNNPHYIEYTKKIVHKMGELFGNDERVIGWQIDNEIYPWGKGCFCKHCRAKFMDFLKNKYGTIENLNNQWNNNLFSMAYDCFEDIPSPDIGSQTPHLRLDWALFQAESNVNYIKLQGDILKQYTKVPVSTDIMPFNALDYDKMFENLDIVQFNHYNSKDNLNQVMFWFDYVRSFKNKPFWNTETSTCWNGATATEDNFKPEGFCRVNSFLPLAKGGEANLYWLWRTHWAGHEMMHGAVLDSSGRPLHIFDEVKQVADDFKKSADFLANTKVEQNVAIHFSSHNWNMMESQSLIMHLNYNSQVVNTFYNPILESGVHTDVISLRGDLKPYKLVFTPLLLSLEEGDFRRRIKDWIFNGGTWVVGPMTDVRNQYGAKYIHSPFGMLEELTGIHCNYQLPDKQKSFTTKWSDGTDFVGDIWFDAYSNAEDEESWVNYTGGHSALIGKSVIVQKSFGKGNIIMLGTYPSEADMKKLLAKIYSQIDIHPYKVDGNILVVPRKGKDLSGIIMVEYKGKEGKISLDEPMLDIITGKIKAGDFVMKPWDIMVLQPL